MKIKLEERMTAEEINGLFSVERKRIPKGHTSKVKRGFRKAVQSEDTLAEGVSTHPPGSEERLADLAEFYDIATQFDTPPSPFNC
jgi:hypothetical protein